MATKSYISSCASKGYHDDYEMSDYKQDTSHYTQEYEENNNEYNSEAVQTDLTSDRDDVGERHCRSPELYDAGFSDEAMVSDDHLGESHVDDGGRVTALLNTQVCSYACKFIQAIRYFNNTVFNRRNAEVMVTKLLDRDITREMKLHEIM